MTTALGRRAWSAPRPSLFDHRVAVRLAATEYARCLELFQRLEPAHWSMPTVNTGWTVRTTAGHMVGMVEMMSSLPRLIRQESTALRHARRAGLPVSIDALTALQVQQNAALSTEQLVAKWRALVPKATWTRSRLRGLIRNRPLPEAQLVDGEYERWTIGYLTDVIQTRDPFMHRLDIHAATGLPPHVTAEHEGRIVDDIVLEWAQRHGMPYTLELTGPAGGAWGTGGGDRISLDALEFCRRVSGRGQRAGLLATSVPF